MLLDAEPIDRRKRVVDARVAELVIEERKSDRRRREERVEQRERALGLVVEPRVVDRECEATRKVLGKREVHRGVVAVLRRDKSVTAPSVRPRAISGTIMYERMPSRS